MLPFGSLLLQEKGVFWFYFKDGLDQRWQTPGPRAESALHLVESGLAPRFYPAAAAPSSRFTVTEQLQFRSPEVTFGPLKATKADVALVTMSLTPRRCTLLQRPFFVSKQPLYLGIVFDLQKTGDNSTETRYTPPRLPCLVPPALRQTRVTVNGPPWTH